MDPYISAVDTRAEISETNIAVSRPRPRSWNHWSQARDWDRYFLSLVSSSRLRPRLFKHGLKLETRPRLFKHGLKLETDTETFEIWSIAQGKILLAIPQRLRIRENIAHLYICGLTKQRNEMTQFVCNPLFHLGLGKVAETWCPVYPGSGITQVM